MLEVKNASVSFGKSTVLHPLSLTLETGRLTVVVGPNGAGKSTLLKVLTGELTPTSGEALLDGRPLASFRPGELANRRAVLPQASQLAFPFNVFEVVRLGFTSSRIAHTDRDALAQEALDRVDLSRHAGRFYHQLSGGEQQRVHLARVLCQLAGARVEENSQFLLLDEPTSSLDIKHQLQILGIARSYSDADTGVLAILHDLNIASLFADRIIVLRDGRCIADGSPAETLTDEVIRDAFDVPLKVNHVPPDAGPFILPQMEQTRTA